jgi:hypothetical protein
MTNLEWVMMSILDIVALLFIIVQTWRMWNYVFRYRGD